MAHRRTLLQLSGATVLGASAVMLGAVFTPFVTRTCVMCPLIGPGTAFAFPSYSLAQGLDRVIVLATIVLLALFAIASLLGIQRRIASAAALVAAVSSLALVAFEGADASGRVVGEDAASPPMELGPHGPIPYVPAHALSPPAYLDAGFFLLLIAALVAVAAAITLVAMVQRMSTDSTDRISPQSLPSPIQG
jgi:hypothetical protein